MIDRSAPHLCAKTGHVFSQSLGGGARGGISDICKAGGRPGGDSCTRYSCPTGGGVDGGKGGEVCVQQPAHGVCSPHIASSLSQVMEGRSFQQLLPRGRHLFSHWPGAQGSGGCDVGAGMPGGEACRGIGCGGSDAVESGVSRGKGGGELVQQRAQSEGVTQTISICEQVMRACSWPQDCPRVVQVLKH